MKFCFGRLTNKGIYDTEMDGVKRNIYGHLWFKEMQLLQIQILQMQFCVWFYTVVNKPIFLFIAFDSIHI